jgi:tetratricopeptide (TPR) repeat protein
MEQVFQPLPWLKTWSLIRLKRYEEAEQAIRATESRGGFVVRAVNDRGALLNKMGRYAEALECFRRYTALAPKDATAWSNCAGGAMANFQFADAEKFLLEATKHVNRNSPRSYYVSLASLYLQQGRLQEAADALRMAAKERARRDPSTWRYEQGNADAAAAALLHATNHLRDAERIARRAYERPSQLGMSSQDDGQRQFHACFFLHCVLSSRIAELRELEIATDDVTGLRTARAALEAECWVLRSKLLKEMNEDLLRYCLVPQDNRSVGTDVAGDLLALLPRGVAWDALATARSADTRPAAAAYYDAYAAELAFRAGDDRECVRLARSALAALPAEAEKGLFCRLSVLVATAAGRLGESTGTSQLDPVLDLDPAVFRRLDVPFPVAIESDGSPAAARLADVLPRSPRLRVATDGFRVRLSTSDGKLRLEMLRHTDARFIDLAVTIDDGDVEAAVRSLFEQVHAKLATPAYSLDPASIAALDGLQAGTAERDAIGSIVDKFRVKK